MTTELRSHNGEGIARWEDARRVIGDTRVLAGAQLSQQLLHAPEHLGMVIARYRAAAALIGNLPRIREVGSGEGIGAGILAKGREMYEGFDLDADAVAIAQEQYRNHRHMRFAVEDITKRRAVSGYMDAVVSLDVIEHIPAEQESLFMAGLNGSTYGETGYSVCVVGTPSKNAEHLASPQSRAGHVNLYTPDRFKALMGRYFHTVQFFGMQDTALHFGHPEMAHYLLAVGIGPKRG